MSTSIQDLNICCTGINASRDDYEKNRRRIQKGKEFLVEQKGVAAVQHNELVAAPYSFEFCQKGRPIKKM